MHIIKRYSFTVLWAAFLVMTLQSSPAWALAAGTNIGDITENIVNSAANLPGLLTGISYMLALLLGVTGILKLKDHVENPTQTPLRTPIIRFLIGGALVALPIIYESMRNAISGGNNTFVFDIDSTIANSLSSLFGTISSFVPTMDLNEMLATIIDSLGTVPGFITALAYMLGLLLGVAGLLKIKDHVENPDQTPMREGVIRLLVGGALFALPTVYDVMYNIVGGAGLMAQVNSLFAAAGFLWSGYAVSLCTPASLLGSTLGDSICGLITHAGAFPAFLSAMAYLFGLILGVWGILKIRDHVLDPSKTQIWEGFSRLIAGGLFFALPAVVEIARTTVSPVALGAVAAAPIGAINTYNETAAACGAGLGPVAAAAAAAIGLGPAAAGPAAPTGLDGMLYCLMADILGPVHVVLNLFAMSAGIVLLMIGINRLTKSAQEGAKGPGGLGTIVTFIAAGALISYNELIRAMTATFFTNPITMAFAQMQYTTGMTAAEQAHAHTIISAILKFMIMIGLISFVRGIFIIRGVAEGSQGSSMMAGMTHIIAGALAINLGPLMNAVQSTLGITGFGIAFT